LAGLGLVIVAALGRLNYIIPLVIVYVAHVNALCANGMGVLLRSHRPQQAGSLTALAVSLQFGIAAVSTSLVATFSRSPALAMTRVMGMFALIAIVCAYKVHANHIHA
jgi:DHA1 family bicyclomycin/chloramphenicol resistance-like MFS transporter